MTLAALVHFAEALLWCALLFVSIAGYGVTLLRIFGLRRPSVTLAAISGVPVVVFLGGCLNLARAVTTPALLVLIFLGLLAAGLFIAAGAFRVAGVSRITVADVEVRAEKAHPPSSSHSRAVVLLLLFVGLIFALRLSATVHAGQYQASDDYNYYLAAPVKMFQLHHYAADPFCERRITASIGGNYFLQSLVLVALPLENVQIADRALGLILLAFLSYSLAVTFRLTPAQRAVFAFLVLFTPQVQFNLTFVLLPSALFFGLVYLAANREALAGHPVPFALLLGGVTGAVSSMKSTYLAHSVVFVLAIVFFHWRRSGFAAAARTLLFAVLAAFVVMAPWMIANHSASGTFFYPSLGLGYHYDAYGLYPAPSGAGLHVILHKVVPFCLPLLLLFVLEWFLIGRRRERDIGDEAILALSIAAFVAAMLVGIATGGDSVRRYNYPCMLPAIILLYVACCRAAQTAGVQAVSSETRWLRLLQIGSVAFTVVAAISIWGNRLSNEFMQIPQSLRLSFLDASIVPPEVKAEYAAMQRTIPQGARVLASVNDSFLLDFRTRDMKLADFPGAASLPPGWPSRANGDGLARYLLANHLRYLVYDYANLGDLDTLAPGVLADANRTQWVHSEYAITWRSHQQFAELARTRRQLYDDGQMYVLDLAAPGPGEEGPGNARSSRAGSVRPAKEPLNEPLTASQSPQ